MLSSAKLQRALAGVLVGLVAAIVVVLISGHGSHSTSTARASSQFDGPTMPPNLRAHGFTLTDQRGRRVSLAHERGKVVVLTFIHSLCKDACPFMTEQIKGALNLLPGGGRDVPAIGVSVEPAQDTVRNRDRFLAKHEMTGRMAFLSGPTSAMRPVWQAYKIQPVHGKIDHSTFVLLIDKRGYERVGFAADQLTPDGLAHDISVLEREPA
jgi:protein SCO1/2